MNEQNKRDMRPSKTKRRLQEVVVLLFSCLIFGYLFSSCTSQIQEKPPAESPFKPLPEEMIVTDKMEDVDFSQFKHDSPRHKTVPCLLCHQRTEDSVAPKFASHTTCSGCHTPQFADNSHPICVICHTEQGSDKLKAFPVMQSFRAHFDHTAHFKETNCATCHQIQGQGMTVPAGRNAHASCFQCHTSDKMVGERNIGSCSTCHEPGAANRITDSVGQIGFNFDHQRHSGLNCNSCHNPTSGNRMSELNISMHSGQANSCATCHNEQKAFGANDFSDCRKCHQEVAGARSFGVKFNHEVHTKTDCAVCHKSGAKGVNFSVPNGEAAHKTCFACHSPTKDRSSFGTSKCFQCHQIGGTNNILPARQTIPGNFSHEKHGFMDCNSCHNAARGEMNAPAVVMHKKAKTTVSCASCHDNQSAFGEDFTNCKRCHTGGNFKF
jgi:c(7)-type cytochrome triheme protein